jgi:KUP system potassium uptake protein
MRGLDVMEEAPPIFNKDNAKAAAWIGALGVVYGDIGTSPIYTLGACLKVFPSIGAHEVIGVLSVIIWLLLLIVSLKYAVFITRADNKGEGGIFALLSLMKEKQWHIGLSTKILIFGAALLYGDGIITPAISVLSAVEGMKSIDPSLSPLVLPFSVAILSALFFVQSKGSGRIGSWFGPIMLIWFASLALLGLRAIFQAPIILSAFNPYWAFGLFISTLVALLLF